MFMTHLTNISLWKYVLAYGETMKIMRGSHMGKFMVSLRKTLREYVFYMYLFTVGKPLEKKKVK